MTSTDSVRAFFAVDLADDARAAAAAAVSRLRGREAFAGIRWTDPEAYHVTVRFLGDVERGRLGPLRQAVSAHVKDVAAFELELGSLSPFPPNRRPHVVALEVAPEAPLRELADAVQSGIEAAGQTCDARPLRPHVTLGRVRRGAKAPRRRAFAGLPAPAAEPFAVEEVVLYQSRLDPRGARYTPLERVALARRDTHHPS
ncbi:MAG: RNA 2',3'-cyclic phosphodiesterase [Proteobacteria bacterium]|nr:RNA 2',3'-cyclic phosphodiesterase [Pseudomonadota bacterium]